MTNERISTQSQTAPEPEKTDAPKPVTEPAKPAEVVTPPKTTL